MKKISYIAFLLIAVLIASCVRYNSYSKRRWRSVNCPTNFGGTANGKSQRFNSFTSQEEYNKLIENGWKQSTMDPLSTFSIDVDAASYSNVRRFINNGQLPPPDAVRIEEMVNYFKYNYPQPSGDDPFSITSSLAQCPWNPKHQLLSIGMQGKQIAAENLPPSNLVFLIDVSGSMLEPNKLPLVKTSLRMLTQQLRKQDKISIVVYAGNAGLVLPPTRGDQKDNIMSAIEGMEAGGSTAGGAGIVLAYKVAKENFMPGGNNRVILSTDGDFNVGVSDDAGLEDMIIEKRKEGIYLTVLGFGMGNLKDKKMEMLADKGNGNYAYIDNALEAQKVLVKQFGGTIYTIAKDVKIQVEWNPAKVKGYRLIGYEDRLLNKEDFNDDKKDAGELGSGHTVTALYEIIPAGSDEKIPGTDSLKYQKMMPKKENNGNEWLTVKLRYKKPDSETSNLLTYAVKGEASAFDNAPENLRWAAAVAGFGMVLRKSEYKGTATFGNILNWGRAAKGPDEEGYRTEFLRLVDAASQLKGDTGMK